MGASTTTVAATKFFPPRAASFHCHFRPLSSSKHSPFFSNTSLTSITCNRSNLQVTCRQAIGRSDHGNYDGTTVDKVLDEASVSAFAKLLLDFVASNFLPIALMSSVVLGIVNPTPGCHAHKWCLSKFSTFGIFFISGLKLKGEDIGAVAEAWPVVIFGLASILLISPIFAKVVLQFQLASQEFLTGLALFCCVPTTLSSGVALTQLAGGNSALALALNVTSNLLGILTVPMSDLIWSQGKSRNDIPRSSLDMLSSKLVYSISSYKVLFRGFGVSIPTGQLFWSLIFSLLIPVVLGKVVRNSFQGLANYVDQKHKILSMISTILLSLTPWMQVSKSRNLLLMVRSQVFLEAIMMGIFGGRDSVYANKKNFRTLLIVCSQKALLIVVTIVEQLGGALGQSGLLVLPCVAAHINQVVIDSFLANFWLQKDELNQKRRKF